MWYDEGALLQCVVCLGSVVTRNYVRVLVRRWDLDLEVVHIVRQKRGCGLHTPFESHLSSRLYS